MAARLAGLVGLLVAVSRAADVTEFRMPGVLPQLNDSYLCTSVALDMSEDHFLVGFTPHASMHTAHHMLLFGCEEPGSTEEVWDCGEMSNTQSGFDKAPTCASKPNIIYAWAHDAPALQLPEGVGFKVAGDTNIQHLVLQVHYMHRTPEPDFSGVDIESTNQPVPKSAATLLMVTGGKMQPQSKETFETACVVDEDVEIHPFAFRTHTHRHGKEVSGWLVKEDETGVDQWTLLGSRDPQLPQMFVPVVNTSLVISQGDVLAARCSMENTEKRVVGVGASGDDEMCNFYLMYWVDGDETLRDNTCYSSGPPGYYWTTEAGLNHIPK